MTTTPPTIGILAGMGAHSTAPFVELVVRECQRQTGATRDSDYPHMLIYSLPTPMSLDLPMDRALVERTIVGGLRRLEDAGVGSRRSRPARSPPRSPRAGTGSSPRSRPPAPTP